MVEQFLKKLWLEIAVLWHKQTNVLCMEHQFHSIFVLHHPNSLTLKQISITVYLRIGYIKISTSFL